MSIYKPTDLAAVKTLYDESNGSIDFTDEDAVVVAATYVPALVAEVEALREESDRGYRRYAELRGLYVDCLAARDTAIAHDRQPYPTAAAYEAVCRALEKQRTATEDLQSYATTLELMLNESQQLQAVARRGEGRVPCISCGIVTADYMFANCCGMPMCMTCHDTHGWCKQDNDDSAGAA